jgi:hypothetical protein
MDQKKVQEEEEELYAVALSPEKLVMGERKNGYGGGSKRKS